jgi:hypothetical protein
MTYQNGAQPALDHLSDLRIKSIGNVARSLPVVITHMVMSTSLLKVADPVIGVSSNAIDKLNSDALYQHLQDQVLATKAEWQAKVLQLSPHLRSVGTFSIDLLVFFFFFLFGGGG